MFAYHLQPMLCCEFIFRFLLPKLLRLHVARAHEAIVLIQAWWRGNRVRRILQEEKLKCILSREKVRQWHRRLLALPAKSCQHLLYHPAATVAVS